MTVFIILLSLAINALAGYLLLVQRSDIHDHQAREERLYNAVPKPAGASCMAAEERAVRR